MLPGVDALPEAGSLLAAELSADAEPVLPLGGAPALLEGELALLELLADELELLEEELELLELLEDELELLDGVLGGCGVVGLLALGQPVSNRQAHTSAAGAGKRAITRLC